MICIRSTPFACALLVLALVFPVALGVDPLPVIQLAPPGTRLKDLPGANVLFPNTTVDAIDMELTPATIKANDSDGLLLQFNTDVYKSKGSNEVFIFGPTIRAKRGEEFTIKVTNNLDARESNSELQYGVGDTNLHTHGLHDDPGARTQQVDSQYGGDNIFIEIPGKPTPDSTPSSLTLVNLIAGNHLPGLHWYHPHKHGSTALQAFTSNGLILVDDDPVWLPDANGCEQVRTVMESAEDVILHLELLTFGPPEAAYDLKAENTPLNIMADANVQIASATGNSTLCCNDTNSVTNPTNLAEVPGAGPLLGSGSDEDILFVNGGYQPTIPMRSAEWQRWRLAHTGYKRFLDLQIFDPETGNVTSDCELMLLAKDGVYLLEIPRVVEHILLSAANRAELLVRCSGPVGKKFRIQSGRTPDTPYSFGSPPVLFAMAPDRLAHNQTTVATIEIEEGGQPGPDIKPRACTPLRPAYAADMRDEAIKAAGAADKIIRDPSMTMGLNVTSGCNIGGETFTYPDSNPITLPIGNIVEWEVFGAGAHPLHLHVNPMQIVGMGDELLYPNTTYTSYFEEGDFHDTVFLPMVTMVRNAEGQLPNVTLRVQPGRYAGYAVAHCHFLQHEDAGCMRVVKFSCPGQGFDGDYQPEVCEYTRPVPGTFAQ